MAIKKTLPLFQIGDRVKIHYSDWKGRIVEYRGPLAPGGKHVYRVRIPDKPKPIYIELPEDEMTVLPTRPKAKPGPSGSQAPQTPGQQGDGTATTFPFFRKGDRVAIRDTTWRGRIVDLRIPSAPERAYVYRVRVPAEPRSIYVELPANYLVAIPSPTKKKSRSSAQRRLRDERKDK